MRERGRSRGRDAPNGVGDAWVSEAENRGTGVGYDGVAESSWSSVPALVWPADCFEVEAFEGNVLRDSHVLAALLLPRNKASHCSRF